MNKKKMLIIRAIFVLLLLVATFTAIFYFSSQEGITSNELSQQVIRKIIDFLGPTKDLSDAEKMELVYTWNPIIRKVAHFSIYTLVGIWGMALMCTYNISNKKRWILSLEMGILYAALDEFHQSFVSSRTASIIDVGIDTLGVITGILIVFIIVKIFHKIKKKRDNVEDNIEYNSKKE